MNNGKINIQDITSIVNENLSFAEQLKERYTSNLCARLGFQKSRGYRGKAVIIWSEPLVERLRKDQRYTLCFSADLSTPTPSDTPSVPSAPSKIHLEQWGT